MTFQQLTYFYHVAKTLSFSKAAAQCYVAQTAVSKQIQNLEDELGCMLFVRDGRQVTLTPAGDNLKVYAERIIKLWNDGLASTKKISGENYERSSIVVGYWGCIESTKLTFIFRDFIKTEPNCRIYYTHLTLNNIVNCLLNGTVDLIIVPQAHIEEEGAIRSCPLISSSYGLVMSREHPLARKETLLPIDIVNETFIQRIVTASRGMCNASQRCWEQLGFYPENFIEVNEYKSAMMMVSNNMGVTISPDYVEEIESEGLVYRQIEGLTVEEVIALGCTDSPEKPVVRRFLKYLDAKMSE